MKQAKVILITGGRIGLGLVIAEKLARRGDIVYCTSREPNSIKSKGIIYLKLDITSDDNVKSIVEQVMCKEGRIDVLVNNAGVTLSGPTLKFSSRDFKEIFDINVIGAFRIIQAVTLARSHIKLIINITSLSGILSLPNYGLYSASKFGIEALGVALKYELISKSIGVVNLTVGALHSPMKVKFSHKPIRERSKFINWLIPLTKSESVADIVYNLAHSNRAPVKILVGRDTHIIYFIQKVFPYFILEKIILFIHRK